jgi:hypothetical protein
MARWVHRSPGFNFITMIIFSVLHCDLVILGLGALFKPQGSPKPLYASMGKLN